MTSLIKQLWQRLWCRLLSIAAITFAVPMAHPFIRQTLFGPTIDGIPWCVWEARVREQVNMDQPKSRLYQILEKIGLLRPSGDWDFDSKKATPLYLCLADDPKPRVRVFAMRRLHCLDNDDVIALARRHRADDHPVCRLTAAHVLWRASKDKELRHIVAPLVDHADYEVRVIAIRVLADMSSEMPENYDAFAKLALIPMRWSAHKP